MQKEEQKDQEQCEEIPELIVVDGTEPLVFHVSELRQWYMCRRIVYYQRLLRFMRPLTYGMRAGMEAHERVRAKERRRTLRAYKLPDGTRHFDVVLYVPELKLSGIVDLVIERAEELIPVDFKDTPRATSQHFAVQVVGYGLLLEHVWGKPVRRGFVYSIPRRRAHEVSLTSTWRRRVSQAIGEMSKAIEQNRLPPPPRSKRLCVTCEFRRFCNDIF